LSQSSSTPSKLARESEDALLEEHSRLSPEERLNAFLSHCRLLAQLQEAGETLRSVKAEQRQ
jgi:hypothetical protein